MSWLSVELFKRDMIKLGRFRLTSGLESPFYIDLRELYSYPELVERLVNEISLVVDLSKYDAIVGIATSGLVLASILAYKFKKPLSYVRIERKHHGTQSVIEGIVSSKRCIIVDDVATTGGSIEHAHNIVRGLGGVPVAALVVIDREQGAMDRVKRLGMEFYSYIKVSDIFNHLYEGGYISKELYSEIIDYIKSFKQLQQ